MFSRKDQILRKTGSKGIGRYQFLSLLVKEFQETKSLDNKKQVLANLANFAYDPINYEFLRELGVIQIFLNELLENDDNCLHYALAGLCNLSADPCNKKIIVENGGIHLITQFLKHKEDEVSLNALATLFFITSENRDYMTSEIVSNVSELQNLNDNRFKNIALIFLENHVS